MLLAAKKVRVQALPKEINHFSVFAVHFYI